MKGKFIVIEGTDGSGKATQTGLLMEALKKRGLRVETLDFPRYGENAFADLAGRYLKGEFGKINDLSPYYCVLPYMIDQYMASRQIKKWLDEGRMIITNRYTTSNFAFQTAKFKHPYQRRTFSSWLWKAAFEDLGMVKPDLVIVLYVPVKTAMGLVENKGKRGYLRKNQKKDIHERTYQYQKQVANEYLRMTKERKDWVLVRCIDNKERLMKKEEIHKRIINLLADRFNVLKHYLRGE